ncbi:hypothetical protein EV424DRAFT_1536162 [Suillus variegatus]|nr:hypothetical protein EV424DRAFT_1536162 [Suillus variegatus]
MVIWLGHGGNACPWDDDVGESALFTTGEKDSDDTDAESTLNEPNAEQSTKEAHDLPTGVPFIKNNKAMTTIVNKSGVHTHIIKYCTCPEADAANIQLFNMGLFLASFIEPKTAFTFNVLNDFLLDNLECGTSAMNYYSKLRRITTSVFPDLVPDHYRELMRVARQWRKLKLLKWNGFGHEEKEYHKHLQDRIANSPLLKMHDELEITPGIGLWHVHGHQDSCYIRYASNFIQGAARIDGEIMETLWAPLNIISLAARGMGTPHRKECLDYQMNDCNFMKMIRMSGCLVYCVHESDSRDHTGKSLCRKYKEAMKGVADSNMAFEQLDESTDANKVKDWEAQERLAHEQQHHDPTAMDIYEVQLRKAPTRKQQELRLMAQGQRPGEAHRRGAATWLAEGLAIEEAQVTLQMDVRKLGHWATDTQRLAIGHRRDTLQRDINGWTAARAIILGEELDTEEDMDAELRAFEPEKGVIPLPSNLGLEKCAALGVADIADQELTLRQDQANNALHHIRVHLADKAVIFQKTVRVAKSQALSTRAWAQVHSVDRAVSMNASIYSKCRSQLCRLGSQGQYCRRQSKFKRAEEQCVSLILVFGCQRGLR